MLLAFVVKIYLLFYVYGYFASMCVYAANACSTLLDLKRVLLPWNWTYRKAFVRGAGIEPGPLDKQ